jgi:surface polysaccharide O-acyltransferase-like enzyme
MIVAATGVGCPYFSMKNLSIFETPTDFLFYKGDHEITSLQVLKALAAFAIVLIHTDFIAKNYLEPIIRNAVPLFFMITGYFLLNRNGVLILNRVRHTIIKLLKLTIIAQCFYLAVTFIPNPHKAIEFILKPDQVLSLLFIGGKFGGPLWYLHGTIEALIVLYLAFRFRFARILPYIIVCGLLLNILLGSYAIFWTSGPFPIPIHRNFFTIALPCIYLGMCIRRFEHKIAMSLGKLTFITILLYVLLYVECIGILRKMLLADIFLLTIPTSIMTFAWTLRVRQVSQCSRLANIGRKDSLNIFILHWFIRNTLRETPYDYTSYEWIEVSILSLLISVTLRKIITPLKIYIKTLVSLNKC